MNREAMIEAVKSEAPAARWRHIEGVIETAAVLAERFGADAAKTDVAAILHDVVKFWPVVRMREVIVRAELPADLLDYDKELWHAPAGAVIANERFGITDDDILNAIRYHTSGRPQMSLTEKVVCLADYIEPSRNFPGVNELRDIAQHNMEQALLAAFDGTIRFLIQHRKKIYPLTLSARNALIDELKRNT